MYTYINVGHRTRGEPEMPRLSITLTESQSAALERIAAETGATKQSMIGLAVTAWIRAYDVPQVASQDTPSATASQDESAESWYTVTREGVEVAWLRGRWESAEHRAIIASASRFSRGGAPVELSNAWRYEVQEGETVREL